MNSYYLGLYSKSVKQLDVIQKVVNTRTFANICFPAKMYLNPDNKNMEFSDEILFENSYEFDIDLLPQDYYTKRNVYFGLYSLNGLENTFNCYFKPNNIIMSNVVLKFEQKFVSNGLVTLKILENIIIENINIFDIHLAEIVVKADDNKCWLIPFPQKNPIKVYCYSITFFGKEICDFVGREEILSIKGCSTIYEVENGIILIPQDSVYDPENPKHIEHREYILGQLNAISFQGKGVYL